MHVDIHVQHTVTIATSVQRSHQVVVSLFLFVKLLFDKFIKLIKTVFDCPIIFLVVFWS